MNPCYNCEKSPGDGRECPDGCGKLINYYLWRTEYERHADPQEERREYQFIDDREV